MTESLNVATAPKTGTFQMRINPEIKQNCEEIYSKCGITLTDAVNIFLQQSINVGGLPFVVSSNSESSLKSLGQALLMAELQKGLQSAEEEGWVSEEDIMQEFGGAS